MSTFGPYLRSVMSPLTDVQVAQLIYNDNVTFEDGIGKTLTSQDVRDYKSAVISNIREFERRYPSDIATAAKEYADSLVAAVPPPPPPPPISPGVPISPGPIGGSPVFPPGPSSPVVLPGGEGGSFGGLDQTPEETPPGSSRAIP